MGCNQSKIENEEAVSRCKDRKLFMKDAVTARNAFAAAHSSYATYLKNTGAALSDYAHGEVPPQHHNFAPTSSVSSSSSQPTLASSSVGAAAAGGSSFTTLPPPPPLPDFNNNMGSPIMRSTSMPEIKIQKQDPPSRSVANPILEEEEETESDVEISHDRLKRRSSKGSKSRVAESESTSSMSSSNRQVPAMPTQMPLPIPQQQDTPYDYFFTYDTMPGSTLSDPVPIPAPVSVPIPVPAVKEDEEEEQKKERVRSKEAERKVLEEMHKRTEDDGGEGKRVEKVEEAVAMGQAITGKSAKKVRMVGAGGVEGKRAVKNLLQLFVDLDDHFLKASESAHDVSKMLEATRLHYHSNFADNRGHIDHSARVMRVITWNRSFRGLSNNDDPKDDFDSEEHETHATVLDKLLAWEKKLYDEVKTGELMKYEYQKKVNSLNRVKKRDNSEALEKAKAAVSHLHTRYIVDMQSLDSTVLEINRLRDEQLYPKLVQLVDGMAIMWKTMRDHHMRQEEIVSNLVSLHISQSPMETSEHHHERTYQLWVVVQEWNSQFQKLVNHQKEYIKALNNWLKLNLIPIESSLKEKVSSPPRIQSPPIQRLLHAWHDYLEKLPDEGARTAIANFAAVIQGIWEQQEEEMKLMQKCEETRKELARKTRQFEDWHNKFMQRKVPDELDPERADDNTQKDLVAEKKFIVDSLKKRLEEEEDTYQRECLHVREKSLASLKNRLPLLFRAMTEFGYACSHMYDNLRSISQTRNPPSQR